MLWFLFGQFLFAFRGVHGKGAERHVSKDGFFKRLKLALKMAFSAEYFANYVMGTAGRIAAEKVSDEKKKRLAEKIQRKASMRARR